jgi:hypothetical protein
MLAVVGAGGCDYPFQPFRDNTQAFYSIFGDLDLNAVSTTRPFGGNCAFVATRPAKGNPFAGLVRAGTV